jgi:DNA-binding NarL/FixJ family response regulator
MNRNIFRSPGAGRSLERQVGNDESKNHHVFNVLTPRQLEVVRLVAEGYSTKQIALMLGISAKTVETHRAQLTERLDIHHVAGLVRYALEMGIVSSHQPPRGQANKLNLGDEEFK